MKNSSHVIGQYQNDIPFGHQMIQGGAPNNFILMKNEKQVAPFNSTVGRFKNSNQKSLNYSNFIKFLILDVGLGPG